MSQNFEQFAFSLQHPWGEPAINWITSEIFPYYGGLPLEQQANAYDMPDYQYYGLTVDSNLVAVGSLRRPWSTDEGVDSIMLPTMVVKPELQGRGLGAVMLDHLEGTARHMGGIRMCLNSRTGSRERGFWLRHGYTKPTDSREAALLTKQLVG
jgi:GNAT superfamily N-acetyltransferase